jgi:hypothetical protein
MFSFGINPGIWDKMYTIYSAVPRQQRKSDVMRVVVTLLAAPSIIKQVPHHMNDMGCRTTDEENDL